MSKEKCHIVKIGGKLIDDQALYQQFLNAFSRLSGKKILVHGGGKMGSDFLKRLNIPVQYHEGRRITDQASMDILVMVYAGAINKKIVADLQKLGTDALGLAGCDLNIIRADKRPIKRVDYGYAGDIKEIRSEMIHGLLEMKVVPVFCPITHDKDGQLLNTNADTIAATIATAITTFYEVELHYCFELIGVLEDVAKSDSLISKMTYLDYLRNRGQGKINKGMLPKLSTAFQALQNGVQKVTIGNPQHFLAADNHTTLTS